MSSNEAAAAPGAGTCDLTTNLRPDLEWEVASLADLEILETDAADCSGLDIFQTSDIDLDGLASPFDNWHGTFDGNGFRLTDSNPGSESSPDPEPSLFDSPDGDINIINVIRLGDVSGDIDVGGLIGQTSFAVSITNSYTTGNITGNIEVGGLIGVAIGDVTITNSYTTGNTQGDDNVVGGLIGYAVGDVTITNSYTTGNTQGHRNFVGGLIGVADSEVTITNSYTTGNTQGDAFVGGLIGGADGEVTVTNSYTTGNISGDNLVGGLIGGADGEVTVTNSYTTGNTQGGNLVGGLIGAALGDVTITNSYTIGNTQGDSDVGGLLGFALGVPTIINSFCLESSDGCADGDGVTGTPADVLELTSQSFLSLDYGWDFSSVWCFRSTLNNGYPVLRSITFGPGDTNNCRSARASRRDVTFDPAGGSCADHTSAWTVRFRGSYTLPTATECTRDGHVFLGWTRDPALTTPENLITSRVSRSGTLTAVWGQLPTAPTKVDVLANFLCRQNCNTALIIWPASNTITDTPIITIDDVDATCTGSGEAFGLRWCWITGLTSGSTHTTSVAWRNQYGPGQAASATFTLN